MKNQVAFMPMIQPIPEIHPNDPVQLQTHLRALVLESANINLYQYEDWLTEKDFNGLRDQVLVILGQLCGIIDIVLEPNAAKGDKRSGKSPWFWKSVPLEESSEILTNLIDISHLTKARLLQKINALQTVEFNDGDKYELLELISSCSRKVVDYCNAFDKYLSELFKIKKLIDHEELLDEALGIRDMYAKFRYRLQKLEEQNQDIFQLLLSSGNLLACIVGSSNFHKLRPLDRFQFRQMQNRIMTWVRQLPHDPKKGKQLWQNLQITAEMLMEINNRSILFEHDKNHVLELGLALEKLRPKSKVSRETLLLSEELLGRNPDLDRLLLDEAPIAAEALAGLQASIAAQLGS